MLLAWAIRLFCALALILTPAVSTAQSRPEIVLHSADATFNGLWRSVSDTTAASGTRVEHPDEGAPKPAAALANPEHYFEMTFDADRARPYRLWVRGRAQNDHWANDSVFVQFSSSVDAGGTPVYRIGTTSSTTVIVEEGTNAGLSRWGWADNLYGGSAFGSTIYFAESGPQRIRIQTREDGISIDQIVLSSSTYFTTPPGVPKNDATILPKTGAGATPMPMAFPAITNTLPPGLGEGFRFAEAGDYNGDGRIDLAGLLGEYGEPITIAVILNGGNGFTGASTVQTATIGNPYDVVAGDFNHDGKLDAIGLDNLADRVFFAPGDGAGGWGTPRETNVGDSPLGIAAGDFNGDGRLDLVVTWAHGHVGILLGNGAGGFTLLPGISATGAYPRDVAVGDFNRDGNLDAATVNYHAGTVSVFNGDGAGGLGARRDLLTGAGAYDIVAADLNRDGRMDLATSNISARTVSVFLNLGSGSFAAGVEYSGTSLAREGGSGDVLHAADMNGDGNLDLVVLNHTPDAIGILRGDGSGGLAAAGEFAPSPGGFWSATDLAVGDFDSDSRPDVAGVRHPLLRVTMFWNRPATENRAPVANAGGDQTVRYPDQGDAGLYGGATSDADGHLVKLTWRDEAGNELGAEPGGVHAYWGWLEPGTYVFTLTADDLHGGSDTDTVTVTILSDAEARKEIVLWTTVSPDLYVVEGNWTFTYDDTAAGGASMRNPDQGAPKAPAPLAQAADYIDLQFDAQAGIPYRLWIRGKADNDHWSNDSVYVQFTESVNASGTPVYRVGTTSAATVIIEEGVNAGLSGWGWADTGYGGNGPLVYFASSGPQLIRIQAREDGVAIDQVVLSAERYLTSAPGGAKNDSTILQRR